MREPLVIDRFSDNGEHSHYELIDQDTGNVIWSEDVFDTIPTSPIIGNCSTCQLKSWWLSKYPQIPF